MNEPSTVTYPTAEVLKELKQDIKEVNQKLEKLSTISVELAEVKTEVRNLKEDVRDIKTVQNTLVKEVSDLKGVKSLIIPIIVAVATALLTLLFRLVPNIPH
ncbi:MAG: shikimate dehydrogenase [Crocosphaera sp.]|nr:shikimate dehydrogenase [Crocosphaera sp.]